jgi:phage terminase large subunit GpA-like protein
VPVGTFALKDTIYGRLRIEEAGAGYIHFRKAYGAGYYQQLTAEEVRTKHNSKGFPVREWHKKSAGARNEVLDCWVYAWAAFLSLGVNLDHLEGMMRGAAANDNGRRIRATMEPAAA